MKVLFILPYAGVTSQDRRRLMDDIERHIVYGNDITIQRDKSKEAQQDYGRSIGNELTALMDSLS